MSAREITQLAMANGWLRTTGRTPVRSMESQLSVDILNQHDRSRFMRTGEGEFALRAWKSRYTEYIAPRHQTALFEEDIVVFPREAVTADATLRGCIRIGTDSLFKRILSASFAMKRSEAEDSTRVVQLVSAFVVRNRGRYLTHKRTKRLPESRLHGEYSLMFGGHLNPDDLPPLFDFTKPGESLPWLERELHEEVRFPHYAKKEMRFFGLIYDESRPVSRQHLGVAFTVDVNSPAFEIGERGFFTDAKYESILSINSRRDEFENWSQLLLEALEPQ